MPLARLPAFQLAVHNTSLSRAAQADIRRRATRLRRFDRSITSCRVTITVPQGRRRTDRDLHKVRLALTVPGGAVVIDRQPRQSLPVALDEAFRAAQRRLKDRRRRARDRRRGAGR